MKSILIIGMGKFGHHLCADLIKNGNLYKNGDLKL